MPFDPMYSSDNIWVGSDDTRCLTDDLDDIKSDISALETGKADTNHTHTGYAAASDVTALQTLVGNTAVSTQISNAVDSKVDKVDGKDLSSNDYTDAEKTKLAGIEAGANNTTLSSLGITATATELNYTDGVTSNIQTQLNGKAASSHNHDIIGYYGSDIADTNGWYKVCTVSQSGYSDNNLNLLITQGYSRQAVGHLYIHTRCDNGTAITVQSLKWLYRYGFSAGDAIIVTGSNTWTLYIQQTVARYGRIQIKVLSKSSTSGDLSFSLSNNTTKETTTPTATVTATDGVTVNAATKLSTARTIRTNLASTSTASFDGTANITPGVTGALPIANGGTGATTAASAVTKLGIADYIVEQGSTGIWTYRKWNSGVAECWGRSTISYQISCTTQQASGVYTDATFKGANASLPSGLFTTITFATSNVRSNGYSISQISSISTTSLSYRMWCPYSTVLAAGAGFDFYVKGTWK